MEGLDGLAGLLLSLGLVRGDHVCFSLGVSLNIAAETLRQSIPVLAYPSMLGPLAEEWGGRIQKAVDNATKNIADSIDSTAKNIGSGKLDHEQIVTNIGTILREDYNLTVELSSIGNMGSVEE